MYLSLWVIACQNGHTKYRRYRTLALPIAPGRTIHPENVAVLSVKVCISKGVVAI